MNRSALFLAAIVFILGASACGRSRETGDAWGNFEAVETTVASMANGQIMSLNVDEGSRLKKGEIVGFIDTTSLHLQKQQLFASIESLERQIASTGDQAKVIRTQLKLANITLKRTHRLVSDHAATPQQLDEAQNKVNVLRSRLTATQSQSAVIRSRIKSTRIQADQVDNKIRQSLIVNPVDGIVLVRYAEQGEVAGFGKPLYDIAPLDTIDLRVYVSESQLVQVKLNQQVSVHVDNGSGGMRTYPGRISWISPQAEFTPKNIQTKENRVAEVYAMKVRVPNDGTLKIGMAASVSF